MGKYSIRRYNRNGKKSKQNISFKKYGKQILGGGDVVDKMKNQIESKPVASKKDLVLEGIENPGKNVKEKFNPDFLEKLNQNIGNRSTPAPTPAIKQRPIPTPAPPAQEIPTPAPQETPTSAFQETSTPAPQETPTPAPQETPTPAPTSITDVCSKTTVGSLDQVTQNQLINPISNISTDTSVCKLDFTGDGPFVLSINGKCIVIKKKQLIPIVQGIATIPQTQVQSVTTLENNTTANANTNADPNANESTTDDPTIESVYPTDNNDDTLLQKNPLDPKNNSVSVLSTISVKNPLHNRSNQNKNIINSSKSNKPIDTTDVSNSQKTTGQNNNPSEAEQLTAAVTNSRQNNNLSNNEPLTAAVTNSRQNNNPSEAQPLAAAVTKPVQNNNPSEAQPLAAVVKKSRQNNTTQ